MLSDAMQTLAGRDADMTAEATGATSQRRVASCPPFGKGRELAG